MSSNANHKSYFRLGCCFPTTRHKKSVSSDVTTPNEPKESNGIDHSIHIDHDNVSFDDISDGDTYLHNSAASPVEETMEMVIVPQYRGGVNSQPASKCIMNLDQDMDPERTNGLDIKREHSSTVTSFDEIVKRASLSNSVSSEFDNVPQDTNSDHSLEEMIDEVDRDYNRDQIAYDDSIHPEERYAPETEASAKEQRLSTISGLSLSSSGYGSWRDKGFLLSNSETVDILVEETREDSLRSDLESESSTELNEIRAPVSFCYSVNFLKTECRMKAVK